MIRNIFLLIMLTACSSSKNDNANQNNKKLERYRDFRSKKSDPRSFQIIIDEHYKDYGNESKAISPEEREKKEEDFIDVLKIKLLKGEKFSDYRTESLKKLIYLYDKELLELILNSSNKEELKEFYALVSSEEVLIMFDIYPEKNIAATFFFEILEILVDKSDSINFMKDVQIKKDINLKQFFGNILDLALYAKEASLFKKLLEKDIEITKNEFLKISKNDSDEIIEIFLNKYIDNEEIMELILINNNEDTLLEKAFRFKNKKIIKNLLSRIKKVYLETIVRIIILNDPSILQTFLKDQNLSINIIFNLKDNQGNETHYNLLQYATIKKSNEIAKYLIDKGAYMITSGTTYLLQDLAASYGNSEIIEILLQKGINFNIKFSNGITLLEKIKNLKQNLQSQLNNENQAILVLEISKEIEEYEAIINLIEKNQKF